MKDELKYVIVRTFSAGVFAGYLESQSGQEVVMKNVRRLWYWKGAATLSQLSMEGVKNPTECQFPCEVNRIKLLQAIEILDCTPEAKKSIDSVPIWEKLNTSGVDYSSSSGSRGSSSGSGSGSGDGSGSG